MKPTSIEAVKARLRSNHDEIIRSMKAASQGNPLAAEPDADRRVARLQSKAHITQREAEVVDATIRAMTAAPRPTAEAAEIAFTKAVLPSTGGAEKIWGDTVDFVNASFLEKGARIARSVGRVSFQNETPLGTGFLIGNGLFLTNHHVIPSAEFARQLAIDFDYELDLVGNRRSVTRFLVDSSVFVTDPDSQDGLDYTIVAVGDRIQGTLPLETFGWSGLSSAGDKHMLGEFANVVQHPSGRFKEVVLRENRLVGRYSNALHYVADTEPGSSGSPVFNSEWRPIALHHWGGPWREVFGDDGTPARVDINEGIRISAIVADLRARLPGMPAAVRERVVAALDMGEQPEANPMKLEPNDEAHACRPTAHAPRIDELGRVSWTVPLEISVQIPALAATPPIPAGPAKAIVDAAVSGELSTAERYRDRGGYKRGFLPDFDIPLPNLGEDVSDQAAPNQIAEAGDNPHELKYRHFSVVMNARRKLAFFTACNIDGNSAKSIDRQTKRVTPLDPDSAGLEAMASDAEADSWRRDSRIGANEYTGDTFYAKQLVPGLPDPDDKRRIARMFQKGHLVRRLDPCWGDDAIALQAEEDSFHWTNCCPQVGFFNQGTATPTKPGTGRGQLWRAVENYVLRNAVAEKQRVTSFTGPIFADNDRDYRGVRVPARFFKITVWVDHGKLQSLAMIADQSQVIEVWPEALFSAGEALDASEAYMDEDELDKVGDFLSTVAAVEAATNLDFGKAVRDADVRKGQGEERIDSVDAISLAPARRRKRA
ncbi:DNA/RNA non-specific endonuclease [Sphingomonas cavernae]|nr:DNA/RNA non-specific endonuclease [Sphingomonas cavernae]